MNSNLGADEEPSRAPIRVSASGVVVRKIASNRGDRAVVVDLTIRSGRDDTCTVRIEDAIPAAVRGNDVEFHPRYDPNNWRQTADSVVYEAPLGSGVVRRTVYGVVLDDPGQVDLFRTQPSVEATPTDEPSPPATNGDEAFEFGAKSGAADDGSPAAARETPTATASHTTRDSVVDSLVAELRRRDLDRREREALRQAIGLDTPPEELEALRDAVGRLDARTDDLESTVEREVRWRAELREILGAPPEEG
jgi:hypothetical protein